MPHTFIRTLLNAGRFGKLERDTAFLEETGRTATLKRIKIKNVLADSILISSDGFDSQTFYQGGKGPNMRCDYLLVSDGFAYFIEMKSHERAPEVKFDECIKKFKAVECIAEYIDSVIINFYNKQKIFSNLKRRYILFYLSPSISKTTTSLKPKELNLNDKPESFRSISVVNEAEIDISRLG